MHKVLILKSRPDHRKRFIGYLLKQFYNVREISGSKYYSTLFEIEKSLKENKIDIDCLSMIEQKEVTPEVFVDYLDSAEEHYERYKVTCNNSLLEKHFVEKVPDELNNASVLWNIKGQYKFPALKVSLEKIIRDNLVTLENIDSVFDTYKAVSSSNLLAAKISDQKIYELLSSAKKDSDEYFELAAMRIARGETFTSQGAADQDILLLVDENFISEISSRIEHYIDYGSLLLELITWPKPVTISLAKLMTLNGSGSSMNLEKVLPQFKNIVAAIDVPEETMLKKLNSWSKYLKDKLTPSNLQKIIPDQTFYEIVLIVDNDLTKHILDVSIKYIDQASQEDWGEAFKDNTSYLFNLLGILLKSNKIVELPDHAFSSYKESLKTIATNADDYDISSDSKELWLLLFSKSDNIHLQPTIKDIRDTFIRDVDISEEQFLFFEPLLREQASLIDKSGDVVRKILVPILSDSDCFEVLLENKDFYTPIIISAGNDAFDLIDKIREKIESNPDNTELVDFGGKINADLANNIKILYGKYYSSLKEDSEAFEITNSLKRIVELEKQLHFRVDNGIADGKDLDEGNPKNLYVKYSYKGEEKEKTFDEGKWLRLP